MDDSSFANDSVGDKKSDGDTKLSEKAEKYIRSLVAEKNQLPPELTHAARLIQAEIDSVIKTGDGRIKHRFLDLFHNRSCLVSSKVGLPTKEFPKFNFVGKLLGPKGNTLKRLQEETKCRMVVLGRGSIRDKDKEEALRSSNDRKFMHLLDDLHVEVSAFAQPAEAHARMAYGLAELRKYIIPDNSDEISEQQAREMGIFSNMDQESQEDEYYGGQDNTPAPSSHNMRGWGGQRGRRGAVRGRGSTRGHSMGTFNRRDDDNPPMSNFSGGRGRGGNSNRGRAPDYFDHSGYGRGNNSGGNDDSYQNFDDGGDYSCDDYNDGSYFRRNNESGRGQWKQRGGASRFGERSAPYTRRN